MKYPVLNNMVKELAENGVECWGRYYDHKNYIKLIFFAQDENTLKKFFEISDKYKKDLSCEKYRGWDITYNWDTAPIRNALRIVRAKRV